MVIACAVQILVDLSKKDVANMNDAPFYQTPNFSEQNATSTLAGRFRPVAPHRLRASRWRSHLPYQLEVVLLDPEQLAGGLRDDGAVPGQVLQDGLAEGGAHAQGAKGHRNLEVVRKFSILL